MERRRKQSTQRRRKGLVPSLACDGDLKVDVWVEGDLCDVTDVCACGDKVDQSLVDAHRVPVPCLGTLTARRLARRDLQVLSIQAKKKRKKEQG